MAMTRLALTGGQQQQIDDLIDDICETFSSETKLLQQQINSLNHTLFTPIEALEENNPFIILHKCFHHPETMILRLEDSASEGQTKVGEVQLCVLNAINKQLQKAAPDEILKQLNWQIMEIAKLINLDNFNKDFQSVRNYRNEENEEEDYYSIQVGPGKIYTARLIPVPDFDTLNLNIEVEYPAGNSVTLKRPHIADLYPDPDEMDEYGGEDDYIKAIKVDAQEEADELVAGHVVKELISNGLLPNNKKLKKNLIYSACNRILTHSYYLSLLENEVISSSDIKNLSHPEIDVLFNKHTLSFLQKGFFDFPMATKASPWGVEVMANAFYYPQVIQDWYRIGSLFNVTEVEGKMLLYPPTINLIKNNILSISQAKALPVHIKPLLAQYMNFFLQEAVNQLQMPSSSSKKQVVDWHEMSALTVKKCNLLCDNSIFKLVTHHILAITEIVSMPLELIDIISDERIADLLLMQKITIDQLYHSVFKLVMHNIIDRTDIASMSPQCIDMICDERISDLLLMKKITLTQLHSHFDTIALIRSHPLLASWIKHNVMEVNEIDPQNSPLLHKRIYSRLLFNRCGNNPYSSRYNITQLFREMPDAANYCNTNFSEFLESVLRRLAYKISNHLQDEAYNCMDYKQRRIYHELIKATNQVEQQQYPDWQAWAKEADKQLKTSIRLHMLEVYSERTKARSFKGTFYPAIHLTNDTKSSIEHICRQIIAIVRLIPETPKKKFGQAFRT